MRAQSIFVDDKFVKEYNGETLEHFAKPKDWAYWCNDIDTQLLLYENDELTVHRYIDDLRAREGTAIDFGVKWGVGFLDPDMQKIVDYMIARGQMRPELSG